MNFFAIFYTVFFILVFSKYSTEIKYDITTIYRISDDNLLYDDLVEYDDNSCIKVNSMEIHSRTNALPVTIIDENGNIISSTKAANFGISPLVGWTLEGWSPTSNEYIVAEPSVTLKTVEKRDCKYVVSQSETYNKISTKKLPEKDRYSLSQYDDNDNEEEEKSWIIKAPADQRIRIEYIDPQDNKNDDIFDDFYESRVKIYDGTSEEFSLLESYSTDKETIKTAVSTGNNIYVTYTKTDDTLDTQPFKAHYVFESQQQLSMIGDNGTLYSPSFLMTSNKICISILYQVSKWKDWATLYMYIQSEDGYTTQLGQAVITEEKKWLYHRFEKEIPEVYLYRNIRVIIYAEKHYESQLFIRKVEECHSDENENIIVVNKEMSLPSSFSDADISEDTRGRCINGGVKTADGAGCICPPGFTGSLCEDGCGKNKYGDDCGGRCSNFRKGCKGLIMCKEEIGCNCAPGFTGKLCQEECDVGSYGAGCNHKCEHCDGDGTCDKFSGICNYGCRPGYFPPLCFYKYKYLSTAPIAVPKGTDSFEVIFSTTYTQGRGTPKFYQIEYKKSEDQEWITQDPYLLPNIDSVNTNLTNLDVFTEYNIRVVLIDADLNSYNGEDIPYATERTECTVPEFINYDLQNLGVTENSLEVSWVYNAEPSWCPLEKFEIYLKDGWRWVLYAHTSENYINITDLNPGRIHKMKIRAVTKNGKAHFSKTHFFKTADEAPGPVGYLRQMSSKSNEIQITWDAPRYTSGNIKHYVVKYKCLKLVGCPTEDCSYSSGEVPTPFRAYKIRGLLPFAQYLISVRAVSANEGPPAIIHAATDHKDPDLSPDVRLPNVTAKTDTSLSIQWGKTKNCTNLNGYLYHYRYEVISEDYRDKDMSGVTTNTSVTIKNLQPDRRYSIKIYYVTSAGFNPRKPLILHAKTRPVDKESSEENLPDEKKESISYEIYSKETETRKPKRRRCRCEPGQLSGEESEELQLTSTTSVTNINDAWEYVTSPSHTNSENDSETGKSGTDYEDENYYKFS